MGAVTMPTNTAATAESDAQIHFTTALIVHGNNNTFDVNAQPIPAPRGGRTTTSDSVSTGAEPGNTREAISVGIAGVLVGAS